jgi:hypothetical protein
VLNQPGNGVGVTTPAGYFVEAINVYSGIESNRWIVPDGTNAGNLADVLALDWDDLVSTDTQLSNIGISTGYFGNGVSFITYVDDQNVFTGGTGSVQFSPIENNPGQKIAYRITAPTGPSDIWTNVQSGNEIPFAIAPGSSIWLRVISANGDPDWNRVYQIRVINDFRVCYHSNGLTITDEATSAEGFGTLPYLVRSYDDNPVPNMVPEIIGGEAGVFIGWNTARSGSGIAYLAGDEIATAAHVELYAQWEKPTVTAALALIAAQLAGAGDTVTLTADFTANDLYAVAALIAASANDITLNMTDAIGITQIPASLFNGCAPLVSVTIPSSITAIGSQAFAGTGMVVNGTEPFDFVSTATNPPSLAADAFGPGPLPPAFKILVPASAEAAYESHLDWSGFTIHIDPHP